MHRLVLFLLVTFGFLSAATHACAYEKEYAFEVVHSSYGNIGTFTENIARTGDTTRIDTHVRVAVRVLGIVAHRKESDRTEIFQADRLASFRSATITNGTRVEVQGEAKGDHFTVTSPAGVADAPGDVVPSDPWMLKDRGVATVVSLETGRIIPTRITGGETVMLSLQGATVATRHLIARGRDQRDPQHEIWLNDHDVPIKFRIVDGGATIDFILTSPLHDAEVAEANLVPMAKDETLKQ